MKSVELLVEISLKLIKRRKYKLFTKEVMTPSEETFPDIVITQIASAVTNYLGFNWENGETELINC